MEEEEEIVKSDSCYVYHKSIEKTCTVYGEIKEKSGFGKITICFDKTDIDVIRSLSAKILENIPEYIKEAPKVLKQQELF